MVYNRDSVWRHLYVAYERMILERTPFAGLDVDEAFTRTTDGAECPIARCYAGAECSPLCASGQGSRPSTWADTCR